MKRLENGNWTFNTRDLMRSAGCDHCSQLAIARENNISGIHDLLEQYLVEPTGLAISYGIAFEAELESELLESLGSDSFKKPEESDRFESTIKLMEQKVPVIYQGYLKQEIGELEFNGMPDFLVREDYLLSFTKDKKLTATKTDRAHSDKYVAWDAKLASNAKPAHLLQLALYSDALAALGLASKADPGLILGSRELVSFEQSEIKPAMIQARTNLLTAIRDFNSRTKLSDLTLHCESKDACKVCEYPDLCSKTREDVDHLVQIAGINRNQIELLRASGIETMEALSTANDSQRPQEILPGTFNKLRQQARLQTQFKKTGKHSVELLPDPEIAVLPLPSENDMFFDMEGFPYFKEKGGLEYLFGCSLRNGHFESFFAHDRAEEKEAFRDFMTFMLGKLDADKSAHVYHYAAYEVTALSRLAARHGIMEREVSELIESGRMIDLYKVVKGSIMISQPSYSIKKLEAFYDFERKSKVLDAGTSIEEYDQYRQLMQSGDKKEAKKVLQQITDYNEDDCVSTMALYNWLADLPGAHSRYQEFQRNKDIKKAREQALRDDRDDSPEARRAKKAEIELERLVKRTSSLSKKVENHIFGLDSSSDELARVWLALTHSMLYYNREDVIKWRDWAIRKEATFDQLHRDRKALVVLGCETDYLEPDFLGVDPETKIKLSYRYRLEPGQTNFLKPEQQIFVRYNLGANQQDTDYGRILSIAGNEIVFQRDATIRSVSFEPNAIFEFEWVPLGNKPATVGDLVERLTGAWQNPRADPGIHHPAMDLLLRTPPRLKTRSELPTPQGEDFLSAISQAVFDLDSSVLAVQGPPGSGKTYLGSRVIKELVESGKKVGVVANSHSAVENLLDAIVEAGVEPAVIAKRNQTGDRMEKPWLTPASNSSLASWRSGKPGYVIGGTSWTFCAKEILSESFDYIFIDEAAQFSLVDALAVSANSNNLVLLGDPQQLTQVVQALHPGGVDNSALGHFMGDSQVLESNRGYFLDVTRRMHPKVNEPVSWLSYQNKLHSHELTNANEIQGLAPGLHLLPVDHSTNSSSSLEEAKQVLEIIKAQTKIISQTDILVVAPYNAQVDLIRDILDQNGFQDVAVGTVDKFQGKEALSVIVSLATSSGLDAPRGLDFVLHRNRLNVAISRAKANAFLVFSSKLAKSRFRDIEELKAISRINGLLEFAVNTKR
jgi:predicted RecB family nuclease